MPGVKDRQDHKVAADYAKGDVRDIWGDTHSRAFLLHIITKAMLHSAKKGANSVGA